MEFTRYCSCDDGPIAPVPENYIPKVLITDEEYDMIYANGENADKAEKFYARDYVVDQLHKYSDKALSGESTEDVLVKLPKEHLKKLFWGVSNCSCCWTHCHNKPIAIDSWEDRSMLDVATEEMIRSDRCHCHCRMAKRMFRRAYFDVPGLPDLEKA